MRRARAAVLSLPLVGVLLASHAAHAAAHAPAFSRGEVLVHYRGDPGERSVDVPAGQSVRAALSDLRSEPAVGYAHPDYLVHAAAFTPNDPGSPGPGGEGRV